jgi:hypothetical protein
LQRVAQNTREVDPRLQMEWPKIGLPLWEVFKRLGRPSSMGGIERIPSQEIVAYQQLRNVRFTSWELDTLAMFDSIAIEIANKKAEG